jgi:hypothetical protein
MSWIDEFLRLLSGGEADVEPGQARFPNPIKITVELSARVILLGEADSRPSCPHCGDNEALDLHQPVDTAPEELLATCGSCRRWYFLIEVGEEGKEVLMVELPGESLLDKLFHERLAPPR